MKHTKGVLFDLDQTVVNSTPVEPLRNYRWDEASKKIPECSLYSGMWKLIYDLQSAGWKIGIVTSSPEKYAKKLIRHFDIRYDALKYFQDTGPTSPHPQPYLAALEEMEVKPTHAWAVGRTQDDIDAANAIGIVSIDGRWARPRKFLPVRPCKNADLSFYQPEEMGDFLLERFDAMVWNYEVVAEEESDNWACGSCDHRWYDPRSKFFPSGQMRYLKCPSCTAYGTNIEDSGEDRFSTENFRFDRWECDSCGHRWRDPRSNWFPSGEPRVLTCPNCKSDRTNNDDVCIIPF